MRIHPDNRKATIAGSRPVASNFTLARLKICNHIKERLGLVFKGTEPLSRGIKDRTRLRIKYGTDPWNCLPTRTIRVYSSRW